MSLFFSSFPYFYEKNKHTRRYPGKGAGTGALLACSSVAVSFPMFVQLTRWIDREETEDDEDAEQEDEEDEA